MARSPSDKDRESVVSGRDGNSDFLFDCNMVNDMASNKTDEQAEQAPLASTNSKAMSWLRSIRFKEIFNRGKD